MRFDIRKRIFIEKKLVELKSATLVQRAYRTKFNDKKCPTRGAILAISRKFDRTGTTLDLPPKPKNERETRTEARIKLEIDFLKIYASSRTNIKVLTNYCHLITKKGFFLPNGG